MRLAKTAAGAGVFVAACAACCAPLVAPWIVALVAAGGAGLALAGQIGVGVLSWPLVLPSTQLPSDAAPLPNRSRRPAPADPRPAATPMMPPNPCFSPPTYSRQRHEDGTGPAVDRRRNPDVDRARSIDPDGTHQDGARLARCPHHLDLATRYGGDRVSAGRR